MPNKFVPIQERKENQVDKLLMEVGHIQATCRHNFSPFTLLKLEESLVKGVFLANDKWGRNDIPILHVQCLNCSAKRYFTVLEKCPQCFGDMKEGHLDGPREKYHGEDRGYHASRFYICTECSFTLVADEWDQ